MGCIEICKNVQFHQNVMKVLKGKEEGGLTDKDNLTRWSNKSCRGSSRRKVHSAKTPRVKENTTLMSDRNKIMLKMSWVRRNTNAFLQTEIQKM